MIPRDIHITWKTKDPAAMEPWMREFIRGWGLLNPGHQVRVSDDADCEALIRSSRDDLQRELGIDILDLYQRLAKPVEKSDLWRYIVVYVHGGLYTDADTACIVPCDEWMLPGDRAIIGFEDFKIEHPTQYCQWTFAAEARHPFFGLLLKRVARAIHEVKGNSSKDTLKRTGPLVFSDALIEYVESRGVKFLDVAGKNVTVCDELRVLDRKAFSGGLVYHRYAGTWKHWLQRPGFIWRQRYLGSHGPKYQA